MIELLIKKVRLALINIFNQLFFGMWVKMYIYLLKNGNFN